ncbi:DUF418 domain-containing protein [Actinomadura darangshiensis]|uniref:DUF418 domain-containing protein n=1 Tax=Actinomadura darangshiensis TaxID=705336 RepID=A0A4R5B947_9ACTN|nr:DUF418 domain-containing protein [Actinomadura darangshiensis]TDD81559.1 DUF418 domain-containing protein [Actinomadura darangshiensis]
MLTPLEEPASDRVRARRGVVLSRNTEVDVLRGFALLGISIVNTVGTSNMPTGVGNPGPAFWAFETLLHQRFFPIFSFLFGVSFGLFLDAVKDRTRHPRLAMLARLGFLVPFGMLHRTLEPDEVLVSYAVVGIVVLLPASFLPVRAVAVTGVLGALAGVAAGGGTWIIPGVFLLGLSAQRFNIKRATEARFRNLAITALAVVLLALCLDVWQVASNADTGSRLASSAGLATAGAYVTTIMLIFRARGGWAVLRRLAPVGRIALTGYIGATVLIIGVSHLIDLETAPRYGTAISVGVFVFTAELIFSWIWLRWARYGPLEWIWRCLTWWQLVPNHRSSQT